MEQKQISVELRTQTGKNSCRQIRMTGLIPGIVYGKGIEPVPVTLNPKELSSALAGEGGRNTLLALKGGGSLEGSMVIVSDILREPLKRAMLHVDLHKLSMEEKVRVHVPINIVGTAIGVKEGGMLDVVMHSLDIECLPGQIPDHIDVDVTDLTIGHSIHVADMKLPAGLKALIDSRASIVSILGKAKDEGTAAAEQ
ncbi:MAG: 50S ribosomal protein L25 [Geobacter sp.]|nr:50S ribosomal protein L25 [Geobacter sp.]